MSKSLTDDCESRSSAATSNAALLAICCCGRSCGPVAALQREATECDAKTPHRFERTIPLLTVYCAKPIAYLSVELGV